MAKREDWFADVEGNLTRGPGELERDTDEFGRDDPASLERERRRRERELRRRKGSRREDRSGDSRRGSAGVVGWLLGGRTDSAGGEAPAPRADRTSGNAEPAEPRRSVGDRAAAGRDAIRRRMGRGPKRPPADPGTYRRRRFAALGLVLVGVLALWFLVAFFQPFAGEGAGEGQVVVNVPEGATPGEVADLLTENDVVSNATFFQWRLRLAGKSDSILPGRHVMASGMSYGAAIDELTGEATGGQIALTIPEGLSRDQAAQLVADAGVEGDYLAATKTAPAGFNPSRYGAKSRGLEGFLFPATYELEPATPVGELVIQQLEAFRQNLAGVDLSAAKKRNLTPYDVLIIASMIDKEVQVPEERPLVAAVIYNRLRRGMPLGIDATTRYEYKVYDQQLTESQLNADTPYNTRTNVGLPPTPIGNPGLDAIKAAAKPAKVDYLYFVVKPGTCGEHNFTASEAEFERFYAEYQRALQAQGGSPTEC